MSSPDSPARAAGATRTTERPLYWVTRAAARRALITLHAVALAVVLVELVLPFGGHGVERVHALDFPASYAAYGFVACVVLVLLGRGLRRVVMRDERYYGDEG